MEKEAAKYVSEMTKYNEVGQDRTGQDRTGQDRTGQDRTGQGEIKSLRHCDCNSNVHVTRQRY